ncbi:MAG: GNAT family N-acetyltransferase [Lewinellaceae bacterium]|nr:GNAT family N-acetyltransferase [Saprospiraceae bacterium]MCB9316332.1 GNAT family N-acetyltransferase [Lewinellaceae bacterium]MCB9330707.1 GNAT family N-acetyltransferase [Lewinellaceae bacterium]
MKQQLLDYQISTDISLLDIYFIHDYLCRHSYWAAGIPEETVRRAIEGSLCFGVYWGGRQLGFARIISDYATFAYLADVFITPEFRGLGLSKALMAFIVEHPKLQGLRRWMLATADAHGLYEQFGFKALARPERIMEISRPDIYTRM